MLISFAMNSYTIYWMSKLFLPLNSLPQLNWPWHVPLCLLMDKHLLDFKLFTDRSKPYLYVFFFFFSGSCIIPGSKWIFKKMLMGWMNQQTVSWMCVFSVFCLDYKVLEAHTRFSISFVILMFSKWKIQGRSEETRDRAHASDLSAKGPGSAWGLAALLSLRSQKYTLKSLFYSWSQVDLSTSKS